jgi:pimeloyl-ACP methyl ester carboxylesterase
MADSRLQLDSGFPVSNGTADANGLPVSKRPPLELRRMRPPGPPPSADQPPTPDPGRPPVLLLHGASAQHETFFIPKGRSLAEFLWDEGYEPWLLDWRGSRRVTDSMSDSDLESFRDELDFDRAEEDLRSALKRIAEVRDREGEPQKIHVVAHCIGAGVLAQAIAKDTVPLGRLGRVVLLTLGLFYETPLDGKLKSQFRVLDRLWKEGSVAIIDPRDPSDKERWPPALKKVYEEIGARWRPHPDADRESDSSHALCNRISFMYGVPYRHSNLVDQIHGVHRVGFAAGCLEPGVGERIRAVDSGEKLAGDKSLAQRLGEHDGLGFVYHVHLVSGTWREKNAEGTLELSGSVGEFRNGNCDLWADDRKIGKCRGKRLGHDVPNALEEQFGGIPLRMYLHGAQNVRRGWAGPFVETAKASDDANSDTSYIGSEAAEHFRSLPAVTLITGAQNQLWHPDSIDRMYQWLTNGQKDASRPVRRHVVSGYAHQDLLWGQNAMNDVFPLILRDGLGGNGTSIPFDSTELPSGPAPSSNA